jgi:hypothetical protein
MTGPAGAGRPVSAQDRVWSAAAEELSAAKSLVRLDERAKQVVTNVSLVGSVITGLGLLAGTRLDQPGPGRVLAVCAVGVALVAMVLAWGAQLLRFQPAVATGNLLEVRDWYRRQFRRAYAVVAAGVLLLVALVLAGIAAVVLLTGDPGGTGPGVSVQVAGTGAAAKLSVRVRMDGLDAGQAVSTDVVGVLPGGSRVTLAREVSRAGGDGSVVSTVEVPGVGTYSAVEVGVDVPGRHCQATLDVTGPAPGTVRCGKR